LTKARRFLLESLRIRWIPATLAEAAARLRPLVPVLNLQTIPA
jgi:hypothetical protein